MGPPGQVAENTDRQGSPDATHQVNGDGPHRIVDLDLVKEQDRADHNRPGNQPDQRGGQGRHLIGAGSNADQSGQNTVQGHRQVRFLEDDPGGEHRPDPAGRSGNTGSDQGQGHEIGVARQNGTAVKAEPAQPQQEDANGGQRHIAGQDGPNPTVFHILPHPGSQQHGSGQGSPATDRVDDG